MSRIDPMEKPPSAQEDAAKAFAAHRALLHYERYNPELRANPYWTMLKLDAYEAFMRAFGEAPRG